MIKGRGEREIMKKLRRTAAVILAMVMVFSMAACGKKQDPKEVFNAMVEKNASLTSMDTTSNMVMTMKQGEETLDMTMEIAMKVSGMDGEGLKYLAETTTSVAGESMDISMFYTDGYYYMDMLGQKMKYPMDLDTILKTVKQSSQSTMITSDMMKEITLEQDGDNTVISYTADPEKAKAYTDSLMGQMGSLTGGEDAVPTIKALSGTYTVNKDGYYTDAAIKADMDLTVQGETVSVTLDMTMKMNNPGQEVTVELPDTADYVEIQAPAAQQ